MLCYLGSGYREYGEHPVAVYRRPYWEFQAVVSGRISPTTPGPSRELSGRKLWIFPPGHYHGWRGKPGERSEVCVFHFTVVPEILEEYVRQTGVVEVALTDEECRRLKDLNGRLQIDIRNPLPLTSLRYNKALNEISLLALEKVALEKVALGNLSFSRRRDQQVVESAVAWYLSNMDRGVGVRDVAEELRVSESHLRRLVGKVLGKSPREVFQEKQLERACDLLERSDLNVTEVADRCGFSGQSVFSRAFTRRFTLSPRAWRRRSAAGSSRAAGSPIGS